MSSASPPGGADEVAHPLARPPDVGSVVRIRADRGDPEQVVELLEGVAFTDARVYARLASRSVWLSASARSFFRLWFSIWRIRSRVTLNVRPTSSSVRGGSPSSP